MPRTACAFVRTRREIPAFAGMTVLAWRGEASALPPPSAIHRKHQLRIGNPLRIRTAFDRHDRGADGEEFDDVARPIVAALVEVGADHAVRPGLGRLELHTLHRDLARLVESEAEIGQLDILADAA